MSARTTPSHSRLLSVDVLRALAALAVVLHHIPRFADGLSSEMRLVLFLPLRLGALGVPLFLVLSGFCIHLRAAAVLARGQEVRGDWGRFWRRRFFRLYPPYLAAIALSVAIYYVVDPRVYPKPEGISDLPRDLIAHLLLIHNLFHEYCYGLGNGVFWSLGLEEQLYGLYFVYLLMRRRWPSGRTLLAVCVVSLVWKGVAALVAGGERRLGPLQGWGTWTGFRGHLLSGMPGRLEP